MTTASKRLLERNIPMPMQNIKKKEKNHHEKATQDINIVLEPDARLKHSSSFLGNSLNNMGRHYRNFRLFFRDSHDEIVLNSHGGIGLLSLQSPIRFFRAICSTSPKVMSVESFQFHQARPAFSNSRFRLRPFNRSTSPTLRLSRMVSLGRMVTTFSKTRSEVNAMASLPKA